MYITLLAGGVFHFSQAQEAESDVDKARRLFAEFQRLLASDPEKAKEPFKEFLTMPDPVQQRMQIWLDTQWLEKRRAFDGASSGSTAGLSPQDKAVVDKHRGTLAQIRIIPSEDQMKKQLVSDGWPALEALLRKVRTDGGDSKPETDADPDESKNALEQLLVIGEFRYQIRKNRRQAVEKPYIELRIPNPAKTSGEINVPAADSIQAGSDARSVLSANEKMKGDIPKAEYDGILELNQWRIAMGLNALKIDPKLCEASRDHSKDMAAGGFFSHTSPIAGKTSFTDRARNFGTTARAENIAINQSSAAANKAWFHSPGHHKNMFAGHEYVGLGVSGRHYTQMFR
ncbi:MAG: CAP domain-containing protein [Verrucomicrobiota bacterium]